MEPVKDALFYPLETAYKTPKSIEGDAIVVLGGGVYNSGRLKASSYKRLITGFLLHKKTGLPIILSGGASISTIPEAKIMKELLKSFGVEENKVIGELRSRDTGENARYVKEICKKLGCKKVILVTSAFHMIRSVKLFEKAGFEIVPYPTDFKYEGRYNVYSFFPKYSVFYDSAIAIREYIGLLFYKLTGRI
ncbi:YdcF family protein [Aquifex pyrophilus]